MAADTEQHLVILGCGTMGEAILGGLLRESRMSPTEVSATTPREPKAERLREKYGIEVSTNNHEACAKASAVLVALKPQRMVDVLDCDSMRAALAGRLVISIAAGVRVATLQRWLPDSSIIRAMPNTPCLIGEGMTVLAPAPDVAPERVAYARGVFESVGRVAELQDKHMDAVTSLNGSGPAFAYVMLEALADGGVMMGLPRAVALQIAAQVLQGSARMVLDTGFHPAALKDQVTTPAGSTIAGLLTMEDGRIRSVLARTIQEAARVAGGLGNDDT